MEVSRNFQFEILDSRAWVKSFLALLLLKMRNPTLIMDLHFVAQVFHKWRQVTLDNFLNPLT